MPDQTERMTKGERDELRRIVRNDFKTLASELHQRERELLAEIEQHVARRFEPSDDAGVDLARKIQEVVNDANQAILVAITEALKSAEGYGADWVPLQPPRVVWKATKRDEMRRALIADLTARTGAARVQLDRQEVDLLKNLSMGALESTAAQAFLASIPTVAQLVPASRMAELEAAFEMQFDGGSDQPGRSYRDLGYESLSSDDVSDDADDDQDDEGDDDG